MHTLTVRRTIVVLFNIASSFCLDSRTVYHKIIISHCIGLHDFASSHLSSTFTGHSGPSPAQYPYGLHEASTTSPVFVRISAFIRRMRTTHFHTACSLPVHATITFAFHHFSVALLTAQLSCQRSCGRGRDGPALPHYMQHGLKRHDISSRSTRLPRR